MARGDRGLQRVGAQRPAQLLRPGERDEAAADEQVVPASAVLVEEEDWLAGGTDARPEPRRLDLHE